MNIRFSYLYRDGANYKEFKEVVFSNPTGFSIEKIEAEIESKLIEGKWFVARNFNLPDLHFTNHPWDDEIDHGWHEFESLEETDEEANGEVDIEKFIENLKAVRI